MQRDHVQRPLHSLWCHGCSQGYGWSKASDGLLTNLTTLHSTYAVRSAATARNLKPKEGVGKLDLAKLKAYEINNDTVGSSLHIYNLVPPIHDPTKSGTIKDNSSRMPFYSCVAVHKPL